MRETWELLRGERRARTFFVALAQSAIGTGAGYVALILIAYSRWNSPWAITLVLLADLLPAMLLGPVFGAAADRWSRKWCTVLADVIRCGAFIGVAFAESIELTLLFALLAGCGTAMFTPAALASLPGLVRRERLPAASSLYGALADLGFTVGPAVAALALLLTSAESLTAANGVTFGISALLLARLGFGDAPDVPPGQRPSLLKEARDGLRVAATMPGIRVVLGASAAALFFAGLFNVAELPLAEDVLGTGDTGYSVLVATFGLGFIVGSLTGARARPVPRLRRYYQLGLLVLGLGFVATGVAPSYAAALMAFALAGFGNGMLLVFERLLIQATVPDRLAGRIFGVKDALTAWAFGIAFISAGALLNLFGVRELILIAGTGGLVVWIAGVVTLRRSWRDKPGAVSGSGAESAGHDVAGEQAPHLVAGRDDRLAVLEDRT